MTKLENYIAKLSIGGQNQFADCFDNFLNLQLSFFCNNPNKRQKELYDYMRNHDDFRQNFVNAIQSYGEEADNFRDPIGDIFMSRVSHGEKGQFFTPDDLSLLMAKFSDTKSGEAVHDYACGSGRTLLKVLQVAREAGKDVELHANDISMTCAKMTLLNFVVNSVIGTVSCGDILLLDYENFTFFKIDRLRHLETGKLLSTYWEYTLANRKEIEEQRNKWWHDVAGLGWVKSHCRKDDEKETSQNNKIDALPTKVKTDENGQISLSL